MNQAEAFIAMWKALSISQQNHHAQQVTERRYHGGVNKHKGGHWTQCPEASCKEQKALYEAAQVFIPESIIHPRNPYALRAFLRRQQKELRERAKNRRLPS